MLEAAEIANTRIYAWEDVLFLRRLIFVWTSTPLELTLLERMRLCAADIFRIVTNTLYAGWVVWGTGKKRACSKYLRDYEPQMHFDASLQIVSQTEFDRVQRIRKERDSTPPRAVYSRYPFSFILKCSYCGRPMGGGYERVKNKNKPGFLRHEYRCPYYFDSRGIEHQSRYITAHAVACAVIPFVADWLRRNPGLSAELEKVARQYSDGSTLQRLEAETRAELEKTAQLKHITDSIAEGILAPREAREKLQELRERRDRLTLDIKGFEEDKQIKNEILEAMNYIRGDIETLLWRAMEFKPNVLARILRLIFKPHSVCVVAYWETEGMVNSREWEKRKGRIVDYQLQDQFKDLQDSTHSPSQDGSCR